MRTRRSPFILFLIASLFGALSQAAQAPLSQQSRHVQAPKAPQSLAPSVDLYVDELNGTIEKTQGDPVALEQSNYPHMTLNGTPSYFYSIFAMEKVVDPSTLNQLVIEAAQANPTISACLARTDIREGSSVAYRSELHELCHLPDLYYGGPINYDISKINGQIDISITVFFNYMGQPQNKTASFQAVHQNQSCVQDFYRSQGLNLNLQFIDDSQQAQPGDLIVNLWDNYTRENALNWSGLSMNEIPYAPEDLCGVMSHEIGHVLGLEDEYADQNCPDRALINNGNFDLMGNSWNFERYPKQLSSAQIQKIISPLCH